MDNTKKRAPMMISLILISLAIVCRLYLSFSQFYIKNTVAFIAIIATMLYVLALINAFIYVYTEDKKTSSKYFKLFIASYAITGLCYLIDDNNIIPLAVKIFEFLSILLLIVLLITKNLGKKKSMLISIAVLAFALAIEILLSGALAAPNYDLHIIR